MNNRSVRALLVNAKQLQGFALRCRGKGKEGLILVFTLTNHSVDILVGEIYVGFVNAFFLSVVLNSNADINQTAAQRLCRFAALPLVGLVHDDSKLPTGELLNILIGKEELLNGADNDAFLVIQSFCKVAGMLFIVDALQQAGNVLKAVDRVLELAVEHNTVGDNNNGIKDALVLVVMEGRQPIGDPSNRVGLAGTG